jgi:hypothetical protein
MNSRRMIRVIHGLVQIRAAMRAVIDRWTFSRCSSGGGTHPNSTSWALSEPHPNNDDSSGEHGKYEQCKNPKDRRPVNEGRRHTDAASPDNEAKSCKSLPQAISNCHGTTFPVNVGPGKPVQLPFSARRRNSVVIECRSRGCAAACHRVCAEARHSTHSGYFRIN